jgi:hypothetical protein
VKCAYFASLYPSDFIYSGRIAINKALINWIKKETVIK